MHDLLALQIKFKTFYTKIGWRLGATSQVSKKRGQDADTFE